LRGIYPQFKGKDRAVPPLLNLHLPIGNSTFFRSYQNQGIRCRRSRVYLWKGRRCACERGREQWWLDRYRSRPEQQHVVAWCIRVRDVWIWDYPFAPVRKICISVAFV